jgi:hypothetical protein
MTLRVIARFQDRACFDRVTAACQKEDDFGPALQIIPRRQVEEPVECLICVEG